MQTVNLNSKLLLAYTEVADGNIDYRYGTKAEVKKARKHILKELKINPYSLLEAQQIHFDRVLAINEENGKMWRGHNVTGVDGFITDQTDITIMLRLADCVPVILYDPEHHALGIIHVGWRGAVKGIHVKALNEMVAAYETNPKKVQIWLGPSAHKCCFISKDAPKQLKEPEWKSYIRKNRGVWKIDLIGFITDTLKSAGALKKNLVSADQCTVEDKDLFSHTRVLEKKEEEGRFAVIASLN